MVCLRTNVVWIVNPNTQSKIWERNPFEWVWLSWSSFNLVWYLAELPASPLERRSQEGYLFLLTTKVLMKWNFAMIVHAISFNRIGLLLTYLNILCRAHSLSLTMMISSPPHLYGKSRNWLSCVDDQLHSLCLCTGRCKHCCQWSLGRAQKEISHLLLPKGETDRAHTGLCERDGSW